MERRASPPVSEGMERRASPPVSEGMERRASPPVSEGMERRASPLVSERMERRASPPVRQDHGALSLRGETLSYPIGAGDGGNGGGSGALAPNAPPLDGYSRACNCGYRSAKKYIA